MSGASTSPKPANNPTLLGLPTEIRQQIFRELFISVSHDDPCHWDSHHPHLRDRRESIGQFCTYFTEVLSESLDYSILLACRKLYDEGLPIMYGETRFYNSTSFNKDVCSDPLAKKSAQHLSKLKHIRFEANLDEVEASTANAIRLLPLSCPLLEDLEVHLVIPARGLSGSFEAWIEPHGELATALSELTLRKGLVLTVKDKDFIGVDVPRQFRIAIASEDKWHCNGWDYTFDTQCFDNGFIKWVRAWTLGATGTGLRFLDEPSDEEIQEIEAALLYSPRFLLCAIRWHESYKARRVSRTPKSPVSRSAGLKQRVWKYINALIPRYGYVDFGNEHSREIVP